MKTDGHALIRDVKQTVSLAGFLIEQGFHVNREKDSQKNRILDGPNGEKMRVYRSARTKDWMWEDIHNGIDGNILQFCTDRMGMKYGQAMGTLRKALKNPPVEPPVGRGGRAPTSNQPRRPTRKLAPLGATSRRYLEGERRIDPATVAAFEHALGQNKHGTLVYPHNLMGDGEERAPDWKHFHGSETDGPGRGKSLFIAVPSGRTEPPPCLLLAESGTTAISGWEMLPGGEKPDTGIASTGGALCEGNRVKLRRTLARMVRAHGEGVPILIDATDQGEARTAERVAEIAKIAREAGVQYRRIVPSVGVKDWNVELRAAKANGWQPEEATQEGPGEAQSENVALEAQPEPDGPEPAQDAAEAQPSSVEAEDAPVVPERRPRSRGR